MDAVQNDDYSGQLRSLRWILAEKFKPLSTARLAQIVRIEHVSVRGVESGRRKLSGDDYRNIEIWLGARWKSDQWVCFWDPAKPYTRADFEFYQSQINSPIFLEAYEADFVKALHTFLPSLKPKEVNTTLLRLDNLLRQIAEENNRVVINITFSSANTETSPTIARKVV